MSTVESIPYPLEFPLGTVCQARYKNHRGEVAVRRFIPRMLWRDPDAGWVLDAWDMHRQAQRCFTLANFVEGTS